MCCLARISLNILLCIQRRHPCIQIPVASTMNRIQIPIKSFFSKILIYLVESSRNFRLMQRVMVMSKNLSVKYGKISSDYLRFCLADLVSGRFLNAFNIAQTITLQVQLSKHDEIQETTLLDTSLHGKATTRSGMKAGYRYWTIIFHEHRMVEWGGFLKQIISFQNTARCFLKNNNINWFWTIYILLSLDVMQETFKFVRIFLCGRGLYTR